MFSPIVYIFFLWLPYLLFFYLMRIMFKYVWTSKSHLLKNKDFNILLFFLTAILLPLVVGFYEMESTMNRFKNTKIDYQQIGERVIRSIENP